MTYGELTLKQVADICNAHKCGFCPLEFLCDGTGCIEPHKIPVNYDVEFNNAYVCLDCNKTFDEPDGYSENVGECWGQPAYQHFLICPYCKSENIVTEEDLLNGECDL